MVLPLSRWRYQSTLVHEGLGYIYDILNIPLAKYKLNGWIGLSIITSDLLLCFMNNIAKFIFRDSIENRGGAHFPFSIFRKIFSGSVRTDFCTLFMLFGGSLYGDNICDMSFFTSLLRLHTKHATQFILKGMNRRFPYGFYGWGLWALNINWSVCFIRRHYNNHLIKYILHKVTEISIKLCWVGGV